MDTALSRRRFLQAAALAVPAVTLLGCHDDNSRDLLAAADSPGPLFLLQEETHFLDAAVERLIPGDAAHPGAPGRPASLPSSIAS